MYDFRQIICATGWAMAHNVSLNSDNEKLEMRKDVVRSFRESINLSIDDFNRLSTKSNIEIFQLLKSIDPISKGLILDLILDVAWVGVDELSDNDWDLFIEIRDYMNINNSIREKIKHDYQNLTKLIRTGERENEKAWKTYCTNYFNALEYEGRFNQWIEELNKINQVELDWFDIDSAVLGSFSEIESRLEIIEHKLALSEKELLIQNLQEELSKKTSENNNINKVERIEESNNSNVSLKKEQERIKNRTHEISISHGVEYCRFCGSTSGLFRADCRRENGHRYSVKKNKNGVWKPKCSKCGSEGANISCSNKL